MAGYTNAPVAIDNQMPLSSVQVPGRTIPTPMQGSQHTITDNVSNETTPVMVEQSLYSWQRNGQVFVATTTRLATATNANLIMGASLFNPTSVRNILVLSAKVMQSSSSSDAYLNLTTANPSFATAITPVNTNTGSANVSLASVTGPAAGAIASVAVSGTQIDTSMLTGLTVYEFIPPNMGLFLPASAANGVAIFTTVTTAGQFYAMTFRWTEFV